KKIIRAAAVQVKPIESSVEDTIFHAIKVAKKAAEKEVDIICLPEHWLPEKVIPTPMSPLPGLQSLAEEYGVAVVGGAFYEKVKGHVRLSSPVIGEDGEIIGRQFKVHLFRFERKYAKPGSSYPIFQVKGYKIGILVCYDVDLPEPSRIYALNCVELIQCLSRLDRTAVTLW